MRLSQPNRQTRRLLKRSEKFLLWAIAPDETNENYLEDAHFIALPIRCGVQPNGVPRASSCPNDAAAAVDVRGLRSAAGGPIRLHLCAGSLTRSPSTY